MPQECINNGGVRACTRVLASDILLLREFLSAHGYLSRGECMHQDDLPTSYTSIERHRQQ